MKSLLKSESSCDRKYTLLRNRKIFVLLHDDYLCMAKKKTTAKRPVKKTKPSLRQRMSLSKQQKIVLGSFLFFLGIALFFSFVSFFYNWQEDQSQIAQFFNRKAEAQNWLNKFGANVSHFFIFRGFGVAAMTIPVLVSLTGIYLFLDLAKSRLRGYWFWGLLVMVWLSVFFGFFESKNDLLGGTVGYEINDLLQDYTGFIGTVLILSFVALIYLVLRLQVTPERIGTFFSTKAKAGKEKIEETHREMQSVSQTEYTAPTGPVSAENSPPPEEVSAPKKKRTVISEFQRYFDNLQPNKEKRKGQNSSETEPKTIASEPDPAGESATVDSSYGYEEEPQTMQKIIIKSEDNPDDVAMEVETAIEEEEVVENLSAKLLKDFGEFDPTLELSNYQYPTIELLKDYSNQSGSITIDQSELEENKNRIVDTLKNYKIEIAQIKATVGPTVTLYEIVPEAGIRISKIKNLEDDIALSLAALGIRIIAPIPGKGTIGIEVPNKKSTIVSMRSVIASTKFQNAEMELPIAFGKTIANETFVVDLAKMPHLLMAGATGQGKSVGLNTILTSILYKKHPAEVKFVLVDPKKVELTLFNKIERHYLAKLPDTEDAIITDNTKVINTLNSLCIEMDARYDLLKDAMVRNIKEYNVKFKARKLNPENGHQFLPYIILVVDEFADLIMTAGKEVETPIARLAQLARAIGIHLIIATQRPSVNVITGIIKANFPARIAFRVTSKIDSRTILDSQGADQLIGRGDMLYTQGNDLTRIQCAFVDTPEVERITEFIGSQKAYPDAHLLPEYVGEESGTSVDIDVSDRDKLFREAAEVVVTAQQGSASLLQRKLKLGYNRAGRIIDQLEAAGVVGPFEGSKARQVMITDLASLDALLNDA